MDQDRGLLICLGLQIKWYLLPVAALTWHRRFTLLLLVDVRTHFYSDRATLTRDVMVIVAGFSLT